MCLYVVFSGKSQNIVVGQLSALEFLSEELKLPSEFFEALYGFYLDDITKYTTIMIKYWRRIRYLEKKRELANQ